MIRSRPQRLFAPAPIGSMLKRGYVTAAPREPADVSGHAYLALVRQCPCLKCGLDPAGVAAHLRMNSGAFNKRQAMAKKPPPEWTTPLCAACHTNDPDSQHRIGEEEFWHRLGVNPFLTCQRLYAQRGDLVAMRAVIMTTIAQRSLA